MKTAVLCLITTSVCFCFGAENSSEAKAGCNESLLASEFSLANAPDFACGSERKKFIDQVVAEMKDNYGGTMVTEDFPHLHLDTPEFVACYLRAFSKPGRDLHAYDFRFERLHARFSRGMATLEDPRLDWDVWRAFLLLENSGHSGEYYEDGEVAGSKVMSSLDSARDLLWAYLTHNAKAILTVTARRDWWMTQLTRDLESPGGHPHRRWFLLQLLCAADPERDALEKVPEVKKLAADGKAPIRLPHPLDPFLLVTGASVKALSFEDAVIDIARQQGLGLRILGLKGEDLPPTQIQTISLEQTKWPSDRSRVINQESWSKRTKDGFGGYEWGVRFLTPVGRRELFATVSLPSERTDGVFFFSFNRKLFVWPKAKMDAAVIQMLTTAGLVSEPLASDLLKRGIVPLPVTLEKESP